MKKAFVFVVCGNNEHLDTLKESYYWLKSKTRYPIYVVTDSVRNEYPIQYENLIDVRVDPSLTNHQAAIWLKTSLHRILPANHLFTYLDTDILAWSNRVDEIFNQFKPPVTFAPDHCKLSQFSPYAVNCGCLDFFYSIREKVYQEINEQDTLSKSSNNFIQQKRRELLNKIDIKKPTLFRKLLFYLQYYFSHRYFYVGNFYFDKKARIWKDESHNIIMYPVDMYKLAKKLNLRWNRITHQLKLTDGRLVFQNSCTHLAEFIKKKFSIKIERANWQHWNGGVFVFNTGDNLFLQTWHELTLQIFNDVDWKTRDQGTLVATVWKLGLQNHPLLHSNWNLIIDYHTLGNDLLDSGEFLVKGKKHYPNFIHVYHHFGDTCWDLWNKIIRFKP